MRAELRDAVAKIVKLLAQGEYSLIEELTGGQHLTAKEMEEAVREYGKTLCLPAADQLQLDVIRVAGRATPTWSVRFDIWTEEQGRSDLSLELTVVDRANGVGIEVDNIHVL